METKQIIIIRKDLNMRRGKEIAQACHASNAFLRQRLDSEGNLARPLLECHQEWFKTGFKKVCLQIGSEQDLLTLHRKALIAGLESYLIEDSGLTEFNGVPTLTCLSIGPDYSEKIDPITSGLQLY